MERNEFLDFTKGVLIVLVSIGHAIQYVMYHNHDFWEDPLFKAIYIFHMPLFMAIAGYLSFRGITQATNLVNYVLRRLWAFILPILIWATLFQTFLFLTIKPDPLNHLPMAIMFEAIWSLWFLWALIGGITCAAIAQAAQPYRAIVFLLLLLVVLALPHQWNIYLFQYTLPFFIAGFYAAALQAWQLQIISRHFPTLFLLTAASYFCFRLWNQNTYIYISGMSFEPHNWLNIGFRWLAGGIVSVFVLLMLFYLQLAIPKAFKHVLILFGRDSLYIYILQSYAFLALFAFSEQHLQLVANLVLRDAIAITAGIVVVGGCWGLGQVMAKDAMMARILFGKISPPRPVKMPPLLVRSARWFWLRRVVQRSRN